MSFLSVVEGYNAPALVESKHQVILSAEAFANQDHENLAPMLEGAKKNLADDFSYDERKQIYLCPQGKELTYHAQPAQTSPHL